MKQNTLTTATLAAGILACGSAATTVQGQTSDPALNALVKKGILTEKEAKDALAAAEADFKKKPGPEVQVSWKEGLSFQSAGGLFKGKLGGRIHLDIASFKESDSVEARFGDIPAAIEFRRVRLSLEGEIGTALPVFFKTEYDFATSETEFKDVFVGIDKIPFVGRVQAGHFKEPIGLDVLTSSRFLTFMERASVMEALAPERNIGVMASGAKLNEHLTYAAGIFTDTGSSGKIVSSLDSNYRGSARLTFLPWYDAAAKGASLVHVGVSGSYIDPGGGTVGTNVFPNLVQIRSRPEAHLAPRFVDTGGIVNPDHAYLAGLEAAAVLGPFSAQAEYVRTWVGAPGGTLAFDGFYIFGSWFITGEHRNYRRSNGTFDRVIPHNSFTDGGIGAWELAVRYSYLDLNDESVRGGRLNNITAGVNWYLNGNAKIQANYVHAMVDRTVTDGVAHIFQGRFAVDF